MGEYPPTSRLTAVMATSTEAGDDAPVPLLDMCGLGLFDALIGLWIPGMLSVFGILGNAISLWVLSRDPVRSTTLTSLKALAASDLVLLIGALGQQVVPLACEMAGSSDPFCLGQGYSRVYFWPIVCAAQTASVWLTVLISTERYFAICSPLTLGRAAGGVRKVRLAIAVIILLSIAFNVPRFFEYRPELVITTSPCPVEDSSTQQMTDCHQNVTRVVLSDSQLRHDSVYRYLYNTALYGVVIYAAPLSTVAALNIRLVRILTAARRNWAALNTNQRHELKATVLPLVIVLVFAVCGTFSLFGFVLDAIYPAVVDYPCWLQVYTAIGNVLVIFKGFIRFYFLGYLPNKN
jgi:hypothetical protein